MKVSTKLYLALAIQFAVALFLIFTILDMQKQQDFDSVVINLAGRQRMLSQKMTKEALLFSEGSLDAGSVSKTAGIFSRTFDALLNGGSAPLDLKATRFTKLPMPSDQAVIKQLKAVAAIWKKFSAHLNRYLSSKGHEDIEYLRNNNVKLLKEMNKAVFLMDLGVKRKVAGVKRLLFIGAIVLAAVFLISLFIVWRNVQYIFSAITSLAGTLNDTSQRTSQQSALLAEKGLQLAEGASEQAAAIEETSASLEEMSAMTQQNADNAGQADELMLKTAKVVEKAMGAMDDLITSMGEISKASEETSKIIKTIDEIAFQTNLLALNAAVEAARAGEAGAGFAVVADEVRNLAIRSADAARSTANLIEGTVKQVEEGSALVNMTNQTFTEVTESTSKVGQLVGEITSASKEQAQGIGQVNIGVTELDKVTQSNAASAEESASSAEELNDLAGYMKKHVVKLSDLVGGASVKQPDSRIKKKRMPSFGFSKMIGFLPGLPKGSPAGG